MPTLAPWVTILVPKAKTRLEAGTAKGIFVSILVVLGAETSLSVFKETPELIPPIDFLGTHFCNLLENLLRQFFAL
jgi:hypothetical protein